MLRTVRPLKKRTRKKYNTLNGLEPRTKRRVPLRRCEVCHREEASMLCEVCGKHICSGCSDVYFSDIDDLDSYLIICSDCASKPDLFEEYIVYPTVADEEF